MSSSNWAMLQIGLVENDPSQPFSVENWFSSEWIFLWQVSAFLKKNHFFCWKSENGKSGNLKPKPLNNWSILSFQLKMLVWDFGPIEMKMIFLFFFFWNYSQKKTIFSAQLSFLSIPFQRPPTNPILNHQGARIFIAHEVSWDWTPVCRSLGWVLVELYCGQWS